MVNPKNTINDTVARILAKLIRIEIGQVDEVNNIEAVQAHRKPGDDKFASCIVLIRDRRVTPGADFRYFRYKLPVLQHFIGHCFGSPYTPRKGDMVLVLFYKNEKGIILGPMYNWEQYPQCKPRSDYDIVTKICQWIKPVKRNDILDFIKFAPGKKPVCTKYFHGPDNGNDPPGPGRDMIWVHECTLGDKEYGGCVIGSEDCTGPFRDCRECVHIDSVPSLKNTWLKVYSSETDCGDSAKNRRVHFHHHCGSFDLWEDNGHRRHENRVLDGDQESPRGSIDYDPTGTIHERAEPDSEEGSRVLIVAHEDPNDIAVEMRYEPTDSFVTIFKDGHIEIGCKNDKITLCTSGESTKIMSNSKIRLEAPVIELVASDRVTIEDGGNGSCDIADPPNEHCPCCAGE